MPQLRLATAYAGEVFGLPLLMLPVYQAFQKMQEKFQHFSFLFDFSEIFGGFQNPSNITNPFKLAKRNLFLFQPH